MAAEAEAGGRDDLELPVVERFDQFGCLRRVGQAAEAPDRGGAQPPVAGRCGEPREGRAAARVPQARQRNQRGQLRVGPAGHPERAHRGAQRGRGLLVLDREPHQRGRGVAVAQHADQLDDRAVWRLFGFGDDLQERPQNPAADRQARVVRRRVAIHRRQESLEQRREQLAAGGRVLSACLRFRQLGFELRQAPAQVRELDGQAPGFGNRVVVARGAQQPGEGVRGVPFIAPAHQQPRQRNRRCRVRVTCNRGPVGRDRQVVGARARLQVAHARQRLRIGARGGRLGMRQRPCHVVTRQCDVGDLEVCLARARRREARDVVEPCDRFIELAGALEQVNEREPGFDGDVAGDARRFSGPHPGQELLQGGDCAGGVAGSLLRFREEQRHLEIVGMGARVVAQLANLRVHAAAALAHQQPEQPHAGLAPQGRVLFTTRQLAVGEREHCVPLGDRFAHLLLVLEDLGQQPVGIDVLGFERLRPFRLDDRVRGEVMLQQHLGQPQVATHRRSDTLAQRRPGCARFVLLADLELRFAQADDHDVVRRIELVQPLPGLERAPILARAGSQRGELLERAPVPAEAHDGAIEGGGGLLAVAAPRLPFDQLHRQLGIVGQTAHQLLERGGGLLLVAELVEQGDDAAPDLDVARRGGQRGAGRDERALQIALGVAHPPEHVPFDRAGRPFELARQLGEGASASRHRERHRPDSTAALGIAWRQLANQRGEHGRDALAVGGIAARDAQARRP
jgi:hypothetical protein